MLGRAECDALGLFDGNELGEELGNILGDVVGAREGRILGSYEGTELTAELGPLLCSALGESDGPLLGFSEGTKLGRELGTSLAALLGGADDETLGSSDGFDDARLGSWEGRFDLITGLGRSLGLALSGFTENAGLGRWEGTELGGSLGSLGVARMQAKKQNSFRPHRSRHRKRSVRVSARDAISDTRGFVVFRDAIGASSSGSPENAVSVSTRSCKGRCAETEGSRLSSSRVERCFFARCRSFVSTVVTFAFDDPAHDDASESSRTSSSSMAVVLFFICAS